MYTQTDMFAIIKPTKNDPDKELPKGVKIDKKYMWCPYCSNPVIFKFDHKLGVKRCPICGISENDYNVKLINNKWD